MKRCQKCSEVKQLSEFSRDTTSRDGHQRVCKACGRRYYQANRARILARMHQYYEADPEEARERVRRWERRLRPAVFAHYGEVCACCGTPENLTIDHVNGDGAAHRAELFGNSRKAGGKFYAWLIRNNLPPGYQTLCHPCNNSKGRRERCTLIHSVDG